MRYRSPWPDRILLAVAAGMLIWSLIFSLFVLLG